MNSGWRRLEQPPPVWQISSDPSILSIDIIAVSWHWAWTLSWILATGWGLRHMRKTLTYCTVDVEKKKVLKNLFIRIFFLVGRPTWKKSTVDAISVFDSTSWGQLWEMYCSYNKSMVNTVLVRDFFYSHPVLIKSVYGGNSCTEH